VFSVRSIPRLQKVKVVVVVVVVVAEVGRGGLYGCTMLRIPHCIDSRLADSGKVVSHTHRPSSIPQKRYFSASGIHF
jgi:hypothetical protein